MVCWMKMVYRHPVSCLCRGSSTFDQRLTLKRSYYEIQYSIGQLFSTILSAGFFHGFALDLQYQDVLLFAVLFPVLL
jgi:hypothetical protein